MRLWLGTLLPLSERMDAAVVSRDEVDDGFDDLLDRMAEEAEEGLLVLLDFINFARMGSPLPSLSPQMQS